MRLIERIRAIFSPRDWHDFTDREPRWKRNFDLTPEQRSARTAKGNRTRALRRKDEAV